MVLKEEYFEQIKAGRIRFGPHSRSLVGATPGSRLLTELTRSSSAVWTGPSARPSNMPRLIPLVEHAPL